MVAFSTIKQLTPPRSQPCLHACHSSRPQSWGLQADMQQLVSDLGPMQGLDGPHCRGVLSKVDKSHTTTLPVLGVAQDLDREDGAIRRELLIQEEFVSISRQVLRSRQTGGQTHISAKTLGACQREMPTLARWQL